MKTPFDFGAKADGSAQDGPLQEWLNAIAGDVGEFPPVTFCHTGALVVRSDTDIFGYGKTRSVLKSLGEHGISNEHLVLDAVQGPRIDRNITLCEVGFHGVPENVMGHWSDFVTFCGVENFTLEKCGLAHRQLDGIVTANNFNMRLVNNEFFDLGTKTISPRPLPGQFVGGTAIFCWRPSYRSWITGNYIHDCLGGGGIWLPVSGDAGGDPGEFFHVTGNTLLDLAEFAIRGAPRGSKVDGNIIARIRNRDVDGHGAVMAGTGWSFNGNDISGCDCAGIQLYNTNDVSVCGNHIRDNNELRLGYPAIRTMSWSPAAMPGTLPPHDCCIRGNYGNGGTDQLDMGGGPQHDMDIGDNHWEREHLQGVHA